MTTKFECHRCPAPPPTKNHLRILEPVSKSPRRTFQCVIEHPALQSMLSKWVIAIPTFSSSIDTWNRLNFNITTSPLLYILKIAPYFEYFFQYTCLLHIFQLHLGNHFPSITLPFSFIPVLLTSFQIKKL